MDDKLAFDALHEAHIQGTVVRVDKGAHEVKRPYDIHSEKVRHRSVKANGEHK